jgi:deoxyadenosine/deoxycytidine kinase
MYASLGTIYCQVTVSCDRTRGVKKKLYISVMGTMGSGKTTVAKLLARSLRFHLIEENFGENAFLERFYSDMKRWAFHSQTFFLMEKTQQLLEVAEALRRSLGPGMVQDTPIQQDAFSYAKAQHVLGNIDDAEWKLYQKIYSSFAPYFPKPDRIIYLDTTVPALLGRIVKRGRGYEQKIPHIYLELLDMLNHRWLSENTAIPVMMIKTDGISPKKIAELIKKKL